MKKLLLGTLLLSMIQSSFALDIITSPVQIFLKPCDNWLRYDYASALCFTQKLAYSTVGRGSGHGDMGAFAFVISLPFTLLNEEATEMTLDTGSLIKQGYSEEDILNYKSDIELIENESEAKKVSSPEKAKTLIEDLISEKRISETTIEILGL